MTATRFCGAGVSPARSHGCKPTTVQAGRPHHNIGRCVRLGLILFAAPFAGTAPAEDVVTLRDPTDGGRREVRGEVKTYSSAGLELAGPNRTMQTFDAADVVKIETPRLPDHLAGLAAWADRDVPAARRKLEAALREEPREWVRRRILAALVPIDLAAADRPAAVAHFAALYRSDPHDAALRLLPALWGDRPATAAARAAANRWRTGDEIERFVAGSLFVADPARRAEGVELLKALSRSATGELAELARLQRWRAKVLAGTTTAPETDAARRRIAFLPEELRAGPTFALGVALAAAGRTDEAAEAFLWPGTVDDADPPRAADALLRAAKLLRRRGDRLAAVRLLREVAARVPFGPAADGAAALLAELAPQTAVLAAPAGP